jgi:hypothetical protein
VIMEPEERKKLAFIQALNTIRNEKIAVRKDKNVQKQAVKLKDVEKESAAIRLARMANRKRRYRAEGKREQGHEAKRTRLR